MKHVREILFGLFCLTVGKYILFSHSLSDVAAFSALGVIFFAYELNIRNAKLEEMAKSIVQLESKVEQSQKQVSEVISHFNIQKITPQRFGNGQQKQF